MTTEPTPRPRARMLIAATVLTYLILPAAVSSAASAEPRFVIEPEVVVLTFLQTDTAFAIERNPVPSQVGGTVKRLEPGAEAGFRLGLGYQFKDRWDVVVRFTTVEADDQQTASGAADIIPLLTHPGDLTDAAGATAMLDQQFDMLVVEVGRTFGDPTGQRARVFGGLSSVGFDQSVGVNYDVFGDPWTVDASNEVGAFGIRFGVEGHLAFGEGASVFGRGALGVYVTSIDLTLLEVDRAAPPQTIVDLTEDVDGSSIGLEAALGFAWNRDFESWRFGFELGFEISNYTDFINTRDFVDDVNSGKSVTRDDDLGLAGGFLRLTFAF